jgi:hypothetical protein
MKFAAAAAASMPAGVYFSDVVTHLTYENFKAALTAEMIVLCLLFFAFKLGWCAKFPP